MKRQRPNGAKLDISLEDVFQFLTDQDLGCDQLHALGREVDRLYSIKANRVVQNLPSDLWLSVFSHVPVPKGNPQASQKCTIHFWLSARRVSKAWYEAISKFDFSSIVSFVQKGTHLNWKYMLTFFKFSNLFIHQPVHIPLLKTAGVKTLELSFDAIRPTQVDEFPSLTQITSLSLHGQTLPTHILKQMTNLESLALYCVEDIDDISTLTNLQSLELWAPTKLTQASIDGLPKLSELIADRPHFFWKGKGKCYFPNQSVDYEGEWLHGKRHGKGLCYNHLFPVGAGPRYEGDWANDKRTGYGIMKFGCGTVYEGDWTDDNMTGKGWGLYANGDTYRGFWFQGARHGEGVYTFASGTTVTGEWSNNHFLWKDEEADAAAMYDDLFWGYALDASITCDDPEHYW